MSSPKKTLEVSSTSFPLNSRLVLKKTFIPFLFLIFVSIFLGRNLLVAGWIVLGLLVIIFLLTVLNYFYLKVFYYRLEEDYLLIKRHVLHPREIVIEYARIKNIIIHRDPLDRLFGLYQIRFESTLTSPNARKMAYIEGLDQVEAHELKVVLEHLIEKDAKHVR